MKRERNGFLFLEQCIKLQSKMLEKLTIKIMTTRDGMDFVLGYGGGRARVLCWWLIFGSQAKRDFYINFFVMV